MFWTDLGKKIFTRNKICPELSEIHCTSGTWRITDRQCGELVNLVNLLDTPRGATSRLTRRDRDTCKIPREGGIRCTKISE
jgi:hypothetical protein